MTRRQRKWRISAWRHRARGGMATCKRHQLAISIWRRNSGNISISCGAAMAKASAMASDAHGISMALAWQHQCSSIGIINSALARWHAWRQNQRKRRSKRWRHQQACLFCVGMAASGSISNVVNDLMASCWRRHVLCAPTINQTGTGYAPSRALAARKRASRRHCMRSSIISA